MDASLLAALSALAGAVIGGLASFSGIWLAQRFESKRSVRHHLFASATTLWSERIKYGAAQGINVLPLEDYIIDFLSFEGILDKLATMSDSELIAVMAQRDARFDALLKYRLDKMRNNPHS